MITAVGTINSMVRASATIGHPLMRQFFERMEAVGVEQALKESIGGADADAFDEVWQAYKDERRLGMSTWSIEDATDFVMKTREAHNDREVACVAILPGSSMKSSPFLCRLPSSRKGERDQSVFGLAEESVFLQTHSGRGSPFSSLQSFRVEESISFLSSSAT